MSDKTILQKGLDNPRIISRQQRAIYELDLLTLFKDDAIDPKFELDTYAIMVAQQQDEYTASQFEAQIKQCYAIIDNLKSNLQIMQNLQTNLIVALEPIIEYLETNRLGIVSKKSMIALAKEALNKTKTI